MQRPLPHLLRRTWLVPLLALVAALVPAAAAPTPAAAQDSGDEAYAAEIRYTDYGVPHVQADDYAGIGYGMGYATATDTLCELFDRVLSVRGERARHLGAGDGDANVISDAYHRELIETGAVERALAGEDPRAPAPSADARALIRGYVAGVNRYLADTGLDALPDPRCADAPWIGELTEMDYWRFIYTYTGPVQPAAFFAAQPPTADRAAGFSALPELELPADPETTGSNAYGLGREVTKNGRGALLGNPHYPWHGQNRFYRMHLTIPGELNVVGAGLINTPIVGIGHTEGVAWSHTVSTARRYGFFRLALDPEDPTAYLVDGESRPMQATDVTIQVRQEDGSLEERTRTLYRTEFGRVVTTSQPAMPWTAEHAYTIRSAAESLGFVDQYLAIWQAQDVGELFEALAAHQQTAFNTTAADADGLAFFGDLGSIPHVTEEKAAACAAGTLGQQLWVGQRIPLLDASRSECEWGTDADAALPGIFGPGNAPHLFREDYVTQSNDSHWLTNPEEPLEGYSRIFGDERTQRSLRTRLGLVQVEERIAGTDGLGDPGFDLETVQEVLYGNRHLAAELVRDDLVDVCRAADEALAPACDVLADWDTRVDVESRGALLFRFWLANGGLHWADAFNPADPVHTPRQLDREHPEVVSALVAAVDQLQALDLPLDAPLGEVQAVERNDERIPVHGAPDTGVFNILTPTGMEEGVGYTEVAHGASWIMTVEFTDEGPRSEGVLTYSQSTNPTSPHYADQTRLYSEEGWDDLRFTEEAVQAGLVRTVEISEPAPQPAEVTRLAGTGRLETAVAISQDGFADQAAEAVVLARADLAPDALAGTPLAVAVGGPLLLTSSTRLEAVVADELQRVLPAGGTVHLLGGEAALGAGVAQAVRALGFETERIAGASRVETSVAVARALGEPTAALVATGSDFPDALAAGAAAAAADGAVLLVNGDMAHPAVTAYLDEQEAAAVFAVGGPAARAYPDAEPVTGPAREETAVAVAERFFDAPAVVGVARRDDFPDALTGGAHVGRLGGPVLITATGALHAAVRGHLCGVAEGVEEAFVYGGDAAIAPGTAAAAGAVLRGEGC